MGWLGAFSQNKSAGDLHLISMIFQAEASEIKRFFHSWNGATGTFTGTFLTSLLTKVALLPSFQFLFHSLTVRFFRPSHLWCSFWRVKVKAKRKRAFGGEEGLNVRLAPLGSKLPSHCISNPIGAIGQSSEKKWAWPLLANWQLRLCVCVLTCARKLHRPTLNYITHHITLHIYVFSK